MKALRASRGQLVEGGIFRVQSRGGRGGGIGHNGVSAGAAGLDAAAEHRAGEICQKIEAITVDSATDELLSGELMRGQCQLQHAEAAAVTPNLRLVLRDVTHASRRPPLL